MPGRSIKKFIAYPLRLNRILQFSLLLPFLLHYVDIFLCPKIYETQTQSVENNETFSSISLLFFRFLKSSEIAFHSTFSLLFFSFSLAILEFLGIPISLLSYHRESKISCHAILVSSSNLITQNHETKNK